jgi:phage-related protein
VVTYGEKITAVLGVDIGDSIEKLKKAKEAFDGLAGKITSFLGLGGSSYAIFSIFKNLMDSAKQLSQISRETGIAVDELAKWKSAVQSMGGDGEAALNSIKGLADAIQNFRLGADTGLAEYLRQLRINIYDSNGEVKSAIQILKELSNSLEFQKYSDAEKYKIGKLMGLDENLLNLLIKFPGQIEEVIAAQEKKIQLDAKAAEISEKVRAGYSRVSTTLGHIGDKIGLVILPYLEPLLVKLDEFLDWALQSDSVIFTLAMLLGGLFIGSLVKVLGIILNLIPGMGLLIGAFKGLFALLLTNPIGWIILAIIALIGVFYLLWTNCEWFRNFWKSIWEDVSSYFSGVVERVRQAFDKGIIQGITRLLWEFNPLTLFRAVMTGIFNYVSKLDIGFQDLINAAEYIIKSFDPVALFIEILDKVVQELTGYSLKEAGEKILNSLWDGMIYVWNSIKAWFGWFDQIFQGFFNFSLLDAGESLLNNFWAGLKATWDTIKTWFEGFKDIILGYFGFDLGAAGRKLIGDLHDGLVFAWDTVKGWFDGLKNIITGSVDIDLVDTGKKIINSILDGLQQAWESIVSWFKDIGSRIADLIPDSVTKVIDFGARVAGTAVDYAGQAVGAVGGALGDAASWVGGLFTGAPATPEAAAIGALGGIQNYSWHTSIGAQTFHVNSVEDARRIAYPPENRNLTMGDLYSAGGGTR